MSAPRPRKRKPSGRSTGGSRQSAGGSGGAVSAPNAQRPTPNAQHLTPNAQRLGRLRALLARVPIVGRRFGPRISRGEALGAVPVRNARIDWEIREPKADAPDATPVVVLKVPRREDGYWRILNRMFAGPAHREVVLDELGTDVWLQCDGENSVEALIRHLAKKHKLERREVELSLTTYLSTLARRGYVGLKVGGD
jgi:hypothetical protein